jgi:hypothetical protein
MAGTLSRSKPSPVIGVVATTWNAGIWAAGGGGEVGGETRADRPARVGVTARAARRTGGGRGAVTVTSGSVVATCPEATSGDVNAPGSVTAPTAAACNKRRFAVASRDAPRPHPHAPRMAPTGEFPSKFWNIRQLRVS